MKHSGLALASLISFLVESAFGQATAFNITAISAANNASRLECWQLDATPTVGRGAVNFDLGNFTNSFVGIIPPNTTTGTIGNAATVQYSLVMAGLVHITTPHSGLPDELNEAWIFGGRYGWLIAADLKELAAQGHITTFPGLQRTIIAQFPVANNTPPAHSVLHEGPCQMFDQLEL
ncbi:hypothetical protein MBLNU457_g2713t1 [Dothideomycetes sp. NU457]